MEEAIIDSKGPQQRQAGGKEGRSMKIRKFKVIREKRREKLVGS